MMQHLSVYQQSNKKVIIDHCSAKKLEIQNAQSHEQLNHTTQPTTLKITNNNEPIQQNTEAAYK